MVKEGEESPALFHSDTPLDVVPFDNTPSAGFQQLETPESKQSNRDAVSS